MKKIRKLNFVIYAIVATLAASTVANASTTIRCYLDKPAKTAKLLPDWIDIERKADPTIVFIRDQIMHDNGDSKRRVNVSRENEKILGITWKGYSMNIGFYHNPVRPNFRLSLVKSTLRARLSHVALRGNVNLSATAKCRRL